MTLIERNLKANGFFKECEDILEKKGKDYNPDGQAFAELKAEAAGLGMKPEQYLMVLASKHWGAIKSHANKGQLESEPIRGRLKDLANYCAIYAVLLEDFS